MPNPHMHYLKFKSINYLTRISIFALKSVYTQ